MTPPRFGLVMKTYTPCQSPHGKGYRQTHQANHDPGRRRPFQDLIHKPLPKTASPACYLCPPGQVTSGIFTTTPSSSVSSSRLADAACTSAVDFRTREDQSFFQVTTVTARNGL